MCAHIPTPAHTCARKVGQVVSHFSLGYFFCILRVHMCVMCVRDVRGHSMCGGESGRAYMRKAGHLVKVGSLFSLGYCFCANRVRHVCAYASKGGGSDRLAVDV